MELQVPPPGLLGGKQRVCGEGDVEVSDELCQTSGGIALVQNPEDIGDIIGGHVASEVSDTIITYALAIFDEIETRVDAGTNWRKVLDEMRAELEDIE